VGNVGIAKDGLPVGAAGAGAGVAVDLEKLKLEKGLLPPPDEALDVSALAVFHFLKEMQG
jgi:hypothetical protein